MCTPLKIVENAIKSFNEKEQYLIENTLSERCICSRFALYITNELIKQKYSGYVADVEYNRNAAKNGEQTDENKKIIYENDNKEIASVPTERPHLITVDLIVHKRGNSSNNLICIEMKKSTNKKGFQSDRVRLKYLTSHKDFRYQLGVMIVINMPDKKKNEKGFLEIESIAEKGIIKSPEICE